MVYDKILGKYCSYLKRYVSVSVHYYQKGANNLHYPVTTCNEVTCKNTECNINKNYIGDKSKGKNFLMDSPFKNR